MSSQCRSAALRLLKTRPRSIREVEARLADKEFASKDIMEAVEYLKQMRLLDDRAFTGGWIRYRLARPFGFQRIIRELKEKGVGDDVIAGAVAEAKKEYSEEAVALALAQRKAERLAGIDAVKRKKRVLDLLLRRGFPMDAAYKAIKEI